MSEELAGRLRHAGTLPPRILQCLTCALHSTDPIRKVYKLADAVNCDRSTLQRDWRRTVAARRGLRLNDALGWLLLARAADLARIHRTWRELGSAMGIDERTLRRNVRRALGSAVHHPRDLAKADLARRACEVITASDAGRTYASGPATPFCFC